MSNKNKNDGLKVERVYTSDAIKDLVRENAELKAFVNAPFTKGSNTTRRDYIKIVWNLSGQLSKAKEILQTVLDKWKEERWILQSEEEVRKIENLMEQAEQFISEVEK